MADRLKYKRKNPFVILSHNFIKCDMLNWNEKNVYTVLMTYADSKRQCFPSIDTLCKVTGKSKKTVIKAIKGLEDKHLLKKESRITKSGQRSNLYTLYDFESINWEADNVEQVPEIVSTELKRKQLFELAKELNYIVTKEKELDSLQAEHSDNESNPNQLTQFNNTTISAENQAPDKYSLDWLKNFFHYDEVVQERPDQQQNIDSVFSILHTVMNTTKSTIKISGEGKPSKTVISRLLKLSKESILYAMDKFSEQTERIKNPASYMTTILYNAPEQHLLDSQNKTTHQNASVNPVVNKNPYQKMKPIDAYRAFPQRQYDYQALEIELQCREIHKETVPDLNDDDLQEQLKNLSIKKNKPKNSAKFS